MPAEKIQLLKMLTNFHIGGTERQVANLALGLDASRFDLHLACLRYSGELLNELKPLRAAREFQIGALYSPRTLVQAVRLGQYIRRSAIKIVHSYGFYPNVFTVPVARLAGAPIVVASIRDTGDVLTPLQRQIQRMVCRLADCVLVNAEAIRQTLIKQGYDASKIVVIRNGITLSTFAKKQPNTRLRQELGVPLSAQLVAVFSRLNQLKGIQYFLEAAMPVAARFPDAQFLIVGDGANRKELEEQAARMGLGERTIFTGFRSDVPDLLSEAAVSVLPSLSEGLSNSLIESMAAGVPPVAARVGGNPEVIEHEVTGLLVPPRDSAALASAIGRLLEDKDLAVKFGQAGMRRVSALFSIERAVEETEHLYQRLVNPRGQREPRPAEVSARV
jgi:glycosyltransferase involved in cell wall biosynthesis